MIVFSLFCAHLLEEEKKTFYLSDVLKPFNGIMLYAKSKCVRVCMFLSLKVSDYKIFASKRNKRKTHKNIHREREREREKSEGESTQQSYTIVK